MKRPLGGLLAALFVAQTGTRVSAIALPWFVLVTTGSAKLTGLVAFCELTPYVLAKAACGPLVDRIGPRRVSWVTDAVSATSAAAIPVLHRSGLLTYPLLLLIVALIGAARGPGDLGKHVMVPEAADRSGTPMERATGLSGVADRLASTIGPAAGGVLIGWAGAVTGLAVEAACFAAGGLVVALWLPRDMGRPAAAEVADRAGYWARMRAGGSWLRAEPLLLTIMVMVAGTNLIDAGFSAVLVPVWARASGGGPAAIGLLGSVMGIAAVGGSLIAAGIAHRLNRRAVYFGGFLVAGAPRFLILAAGAPMWAIVGVFAVAGFGSGFLNPIIGAIALERIPRPLLGRVNAIGDSLAWAGIPLGGLVAGTVLGVIGLVPTLLAAGVCYFVITNVAGLRPEWKHMRLSPN